MRRGITGGKLQNGERGSYGSGIGGRNKIGKAVKRAGTWLLAAGLCVVFCACGNGQNQEQGGLEMFRSEEYNTAGQAALGQDPRTDVSQAEGDQPGQNGENGAGSSRDDVKTAETLEALLASWTSGQAEEVTLAQVQEAFDREGILYTGFCSVSGEWVNMILEDGMTLPFREKAAQEYANEETKRPAEGYLLRVKDGKLEENGTAYGAMPGLLSGSWIDLDGDGSKEQVCFCLAMEDEEIGTATLTVKGGTAGGETSVSLEVCNPHYRCYASSMDGTNTWLVVASNGMSADPMLEFYAYGQGSLKGMGQIASRVENLEIFPDYMTARVETWHFQNQPLELKYVVENDMIVWQEQDYYEYQGNSAKAMAQIPLYGEKNGDDITMTLEAGDQVQVAGGDLKEWVLLKKESTGESGWLKVIGGDCYLPDGTVEMSGLLFEGLPFYG